MRKGAWYRRILGDNPDEFWACIGQDGADYKVRKYTRDGQFICEASAPETLVDLWIDSEELLEDIPSWAVHFPTEKNGNKPICNHPVAEYGKYSYTDTTIWVCPRCYRAYRLEDYPDLGQQWTLAKAQQPTE